MIGFFVSVSVSTSVTGEHASPFVPEMVKSTLPFSISSVLGV